KPIAMSSRSFMTFHTYTLSRFYVITLALTHKRRGNTLRRIMAKASDFDVDLVITISYRALLTRIDRKLQKSGRRLRADRRGGGVRYIVIDTKKRTVVERNIDLAKLAHRLQVLEPWERAPSTAR